MLNLMVSRLSMYSRSKIDYSQLQKDIGGEHTVRLVEEKADALYSYTLDAIRDYKLMMESLKDTLLEQYVLSKDEVFALLEERSELLLPQLHGQRCAKLTLCEEEVAA